jgi:predicted Zn-dependent peptidase
MPPAAIHPQEFTLPNGLRTVIIEVPHLHTVSLVMYARVGSRYESAETNGLSHFVEHMLFRGTAAHPDSLALHRAIEDFGGTLYAETGRDYSLYQIAVHPESLARALGVMAEIFGAPAFPDIDRERQIVVEEILEDQDEDGREINVDDVARAAAWPGHPLGFKITGPLRNVRRFGVADVRRHFARYYGAANMILCLSGAVRARAVMPTVRRRFAGLKAGRGARPLPPPNGQREPRFAYVENRGSQSNLQVLFRALPEQHPDFTALAVLGRVLDDGMSTRLHYRICDQLGLAYYCAGTVEPLHDTALFEVDAASSHAKLPALVAEVLAILAGLRAEAPSAAELDKAKRRARWDLESACDDPDALAGWFAGTRLFYEPDGLQRKIARMAAVTPADVLRVARTVLCPDRLTVAVVGRLQARARRQVEQMIRAFGSAPA